jgi:3-methyladenine DNA glycosylase AlkD
MAKTIMRDEVLERLWAAQDKEYKKFDDRLTPGADPKMKIGVRKPALRVITKDIAKGDFREYINELPEKCYWEERLIHGMLIGTAKVDHAEWEEMIKVFVPYINDWSVCDSMVTTQKRVKKETAETWPLVKKYLRSKRPFDIRFGAIMCLDYYINEEYIGRVLPELIRVSEKITSRVPAEKLRLKKGEAPDDAYYTMMGCAWCIAECCAKFPKETHAVLESGRLDPVTQNKAIQKARESYRVSDDDKEYLKTLKMI